jgi:predicted outer membrane protein
MEGGSAFGIKNLKQVFDNYLEIDYYQPVILLLSRHTMPSPEQGYTPPQESALSPEKQAEILAEIETIIEEKTAASEQYAEQMERDRERFNKDFSIEQLASFFSTDDPAQFLAPQVMDESRQRNLFRFIADYNQTRAQINQLQIDIALLGEIKTALSTANYDELNSLKDKLRQRSATTADKLFKNI